MTTLRNDTMGNQLKRSKLAIQNTIKTPAILALVAPKGYPLAVMNQGLVIYNNADAAVALAASTSGDQGLASEAAAAAWKAVRVAYQDLAKIARAMFMRRTDVLALLGLNQPMPGAAGEFTLAFNKLFNTGAYTPEITAKFLAKGYDSTKFSECRGLFGEWENAAGLHKAAAGDAEDAAEDQEKRLKAMVDWVAEYFKIARVALKDRPQLLEKIGVLVRRTRTKAQRGAPAKAALTRAKNKALKAEKAKAA